MFSTTEIVLLSALMLFFITQLLFYWLVLAKPYYRFRRGKKSTRYASSASGFKGNEPPVSIIICIRNNVNNLKNFLSAIIEQDYPKFEVIVVNDGQSDANEEILAIMKKKYDNLYVTNIPEHTLNVSRKKLGLTLGIKAAQYDYLLFIEADSLPVTKEWIKLMTKHFLRNKSIVLGLSARNNKQGFFSKFITYDYFLSNLQEISLALFHRPYAANGRNLAYAKQHFTEHKGFSKYRILQQGEDDLFINEIADKHNTAVELSPDSLVFTELSKAEWMQLKRNKAITKRFYKRGPVALWGLESWSRAGFFLSLTVCILYGDPFLSLSDFIFPAIAVFCFFTRLFSQFFVINKIAKCLRTEKFYVTLFFFDIIQLFINIYFYTYYIGHKKENYTTNYEKR
jgi:glycosyltransferase involved in cell wall biosynthesis